MANYIDVSIFFDHHLSYLIAVLITIFIVLAFFRVGSKWLYTIVLLLFHLLYVIRYSQGEIPHSQNLIGMSVLIFALGTLLIQEPEKRARFVIGAIVFFIGLGYTSAFFFKIDRDRV